MKKTTDDTAVYLFHQGTNFRSYDFLGVHKTENANYVFRVYAPKADAVHVTGDFCGWSEGVSMNRISKEGIWECICEIKEYDGRMYKFRITHGNRSFLKSDPYAFYSQTGKESASFIYDFKEFKWNDAKWKKSVSECFLKGKYFYPAPLNIYEIHLASWLRKDGEYLNYREIADNLVPYVLQMGYTHVELMPIAEYPYDGSWGYQVCGYYAPTSRFGTPEDFKYFVNKLHESNIGVILDWVPAHFPKDEHGLYEFDGGDLYEYSGEDRREHKVWGTRCFDLARCEVQSFLISNALFWFREYHIDGLRTDAVAAILYLDYDREPGEWNPNVYGENISLEGSAFLKKLNTAVFAEFPFALMIAEESGDCGSVTKPVDQGGMGFNFKWNMGYSNDMFEYMKTDPFFRKHLHRSLTFPSMYAFNENYILPVSHDEVTHGKKSLIDKMYGSYEEKFASLRVFNMFFMTHPGKKMSFMGCEFGQFREWDFSGELEWFMTDYPMHNKLRVYNADLNRFYLSCKPLWEIDFKPEGLNWILPDAAEDNVIAYERIASDGEMVVCIMNFSPVDRKNYRIPLNGEIYTEVMNSDNERYGGRNRKNLGDLVAKNGNLSIFLPGLTGIILKEKKPIFKK
ncbi:MAG: 1,4-alpha-glucan branching protein GlgB [Clostridia bacterium]|nr:1,4-alpha-glucan branching protein GlgB [Clostridia bacterium]